MQFNFCESCGGSESTTACALYCMPENTPWLKPEHAPLPLKHDSFIELCAKCREEANNRVVSMRKFKPTPVQIETP